MGCVFGLVMLLAMALALTIAWRVVSVLVDPLLEPLRPVAVIGLLLLLATMAVLIRGVRRITAPLDALVDGARRVEAGQYDARVPEIRRGPRELRQLTRAFNTMASQLQADQGARRSLLADVSHELRTPLAVLRGNLEAIADGVHPADEAHIAGLIEETRVMERLVEDLRTISLAEAGALPLHREPTDPDVLIGETVASFETTAREAGVELVVDAPPDLPLLDVDPVRIREVLGNLLANAIRHTPAGGRVMVVGAVASDVDAAAPELSGDARVASRTQVVIRVADTGSGIDPELLPHVFERFARGRDSRGSGLGLAIARDLVGAHGGTISVESEPSRGTTFTVRLPLGPPADMRPEA
jgi:signal transduction histidine kinase